MAVGGGAIRALFVAVFVCWYSTGVFRAMDSHFGNHFGQYLRKQIRSNEHMRKDLEADRRAMERVLRAKGKELPAALAEPASFLEGLLQRFQGGDGAQQRTCPGVQDKVLVPLEEACVAQDDAEDAAEDAADKDSDQDGVEHAVEDSCPGPCAVQDDVDKDSCPGVRVVHVDVEEAIDEDAVDKDAVNEDSCPGSLGRQVPEAEPPPAA